MSAEAHGTAPDVGPLEDAVRRRWGQRGVGGAGDHRGGTARAIQVWTAADPRAGDGVRATAVVAADAVVRHRAMVGDAPDLVAGPADARLQDLLACRPAGAVVDAAAPTYVDSVWWSLAQLWDAGLLVEEPHRTAWCPRCDAVRGGDRLRATTDDATGALVRFPVDGDHPLAVAGASLLVDVSAPWSLPATTAVVLAPDADPVLAQAAGDDYPVVVDRSAVVPVLGADATVHRDVGIATLRGLRYRPPVPLSGPAPTARRDVLLIDGAAPRTTTGFAPVAPAADVDALRLAAAHGVAVADPVEPDGTFAAEVAGHAGTAAHGADDRIAAALDARGLVLRTTRVDRRTDRCRRCDAVVLPRARRSWFVATTAVADRLAAERAAVRGVAPAAGRWMAGDTDWHVSRAHGRGVPLPAWRCTGCGWTVLVAGRGHLAELAGRPADDVDDGTDVACPDCGGGARRIPLAVDPRYVAACLPFARFGFPHVAGSDVQVARHSHADLLVEPAGEGPGWTDAATVVATLLWHATGHDAVLRAGAGPDPDVAAAVRRDGVDATRWALLTGADTGTPDQIHGLLGHARTLLADAERLGWTQAEALGAPDVDDRGVLHRWVLAELAATVGDVAAALERTDPAAAARRLAAWADELIWYLDRTPDDEPPVALATRHECLVTTAALLAPLLPLLADELYELLVRADDPTAPPSVHRLRFPTADPSAVDQALRAATAAARRIVGLGRRARRHAGLDDDVVLPEAVACVPAAAHARWHAVAPLVRRALAVADVHRLDRLPDLDASVDGWQVEADDAHAVALDLAVGQARRSEQLARDVISAVHVLRRDRALDLDQRITVRIDAEPEIAAAVEAHREVIADDVRAARIELGPTAQGTAVPVGDRPVRVALRAAVPR